MPYVFRIFFSQLFWHLELKIPFFLVFFLKKVQGLPELYGTAACEMWNSADMAFALEPFLSTGAALAISAHASPELKDKYLPNINAGIWSGTMNLTESGAGSDLGPMKTRAERHGDHYKIFGQKIYITWGDHDATENIIH